MNHHVKKSSSVGFNLNPQELVSHSDENSLEKIYDWTQERIDIYLGILKNAHTYKTEIKLLDYGHSSALSFVIGPHTEHFSCQVTKLDAMELVEEKSFTTFEIFMHISKEISENVDANFSFFDSITAAKIHFHLSAKVMDFNLGTPSLKNGIHLVSKDLDAESEKD